MKKIVPDILATVHFYKTEEGGRKGPTPMEFFACPFVFQGKLYDCRLLLWDHGSIFPGDTVKGVPIKFIFPDVLSKIKEKDKFNLWEGGIKAEGIIEKIIEKS